jgi:hypothetical protein
VAAEDASEADHEAMMGPVVDRLLLRRGIAGVDADTRLLLREAYARGPGMISMAFIMGVLPRVTATGAGSKMRSAMGVAASSGMIGVTAFGLFLTPICSVLLRRLPGNRPLKQHGVGAPIPAQDPIEQAT